MSGVWAIVLLLATGAEPSPAPIPSLKVTTGAGSIYVHLLGGADGPVWLPVEGVAGVWAIQVVGDSRRRARRRACDFGTVAADEAVRPVASYVVRAGEAPVSAEDLERFGLHWKLSVETVAGVPDGCGGCEGVVCCPAPGECLACGLCGRVCAKGGGGGSAVPGRD